MRRNYLLTLLLAFLVLTLPTACRKKTAAEDPTAQNGLLYQSKTSSADSRVEVRRPHSLEIPAAIRTQSEILITRRGYTVSYNKDWRIPNWVAWHLTAAHSRGEQTLQHGVHRRQHRARTTRHGQRLLQLALRPRSHVSLGRQPMGRQGTGGIISLHQYLPPKPRPEPGRLE